jgi:hypothetical protein
MASFFDEACVLVTRQAFGEGAALEQMKGYLKGWRHGAAEIINEQLQIRLRMSYSVRARIKALDGLELSQLGRDMLDFQTLQDLDKWLKKREQAATSAE